MAGFFAFARAAAGVLADRMHDPPDGQVGFAFHAATGPEHVSSDAWHATGGGMSNIKSNNGTVEVNGTLYDWELQREPQWSDAEGWKGMTVSLLERDCRREALLEFPAPKRLLKGLPRGRLQIDDPTVSRGVRAALLAGWEPMSRGKAMVFTVDAEGN